LFFLIGYKSAIGLPQTKKARFPASLQQMKMLFNNKLSKVKDTIKKQLNHIITLLLFQKIVDDLTAVLSLGIKRDMHPVGSLSIVLPDELIERKVAPDILEPLQAFRFVAIYAEVCCLAGEVLTVIHATDGLVQSLATEAAPYLDFFSPPFPERFEHGNTQSRYVHDGLLRRNVGDAFGFGCRAGGELLQAEV
jgi:hypothetical protein